MRSLPFLMLALMLAAAGCDSAGTGSTATVRYAVSGPAAITYTTPAGTPATATTSGAWETEVSVDDGTPVVLTATSPAGQTLTASIFVDDRLVKTSSGASVRLSTSSSSSSGGEVEVEGPIDAISATELTVLGISFAINGQTAFLDDDNNPTTAAAFAVGMRVEVKGRGTAGSLVATRVKPDDDGFDQDEVEEEGTITAIDDASVTVNARRFVTTAQTRYLDDDNNPIARSAFAVGQLAEAEGYVGSDGVLVATKLKQDDD